MRTSDVEAGLRLEEVNAGKTVTEPPSPSYRSPPMQSKFFIHLDKYAVAGENVEFLLSDE